MRRLLMSLFPIVLVLCLVVVRHVASPPSSPARGFVPVSSPTRKRGSVPGGAARGTNGGPVSGGTVASVPPASVMP